MNDEKKVINSNSKRFDVMRFFELMPRAFWVEEVDHVLYHVMTNQTTDETSGH